MKVLKEKGVYAQLALPLAQVQRHPVSAAVNCLHTSRRTGPLPPVSMLLMEKCDGTCLGGRRYGGVTTLNAGRKDGALVGDRKGELMTSERLLLLVPAALAVWLGVAATFFHFYNDWPWTSALYYAIDTGLSIGFGALQPKDDFERLVVAGNVLIGAGAASAALALFTESLLSAGKSITAQELADQMNKDLTQMSSATLLRELTVAQQQSAQKAEARDEARNPMQKLVDGYIRSNASWEEELLVIYLIAGTLYGCLAEGYSPISGVYFAGRAPAFMLRLPLTSDVCMPSPRVSPDCHLYVCVCARMWPASQVSSDVTLDERAAGKLCVSW